MWNAVMPREASRGAGLGVGEGQGSGWGRGGVGLLAAHLAVVTSRGNKGAVGGVRQGVEVMKVPLLLQHICRVQGKEHQHMARADGPQRG
jgi:hypothetical protein